MAIWKQSMPEVHSPLVRSGKWLDFGVDVQAFLDESRKCNELHEECAEESCNENDSACNDGH